MIGDSALCAQEVKKTYSTTHASVMLYKGVSIHSVSKRLGHCDIQTTLDHYAHVLKEMEQRDESLAINIYAN